MPEGIWDRYGDELDTAGFPERSRKVTVYAARQLLSGSAPSQPTPDCAMSTTHRSALQAPIRLLMTVQGLTDYVLIGENIDLIRTERIDIYRGPSGTTKNEVIASLTRGEKSVVICCDVEKADGTPSVRLPDG